MKKVLKVAGIILLIVLALLIILPFAFQGKIKEQLTIAINENVNATVDFDSFSLSFIRNFPNVSVKLSELSVVGVEEFDGDTLAAIGNINVAVDLMSLFGDEGYEIKSIHINDPRVMLMVTQDGVVNWDIAKETAEDPEAATEEETEFQLALKRFSITNGYLVYDDREMDLYTRIEELNHTLSGDFTADFTSLEIRNTTIESLLVRFEGVPYLNNVYASLTADIDADLNAFAFTFKDNVMHINDIEMGFDGSFAMPEEDMVMDFTFSSVETSFKSLLSLVPAIYSKDFEGLQSSGSLSMNGFVDGVYNEENIPGFGVNILVEDGMFQYPDLPAAVTDVNINARIDNPGGDADLTVVDVSRFDLDMGGNPVTMRLNLQTPVSDPQIDAMLKGKIDLARVKDFYPLEESEVLSGTIESDMTAKGRMSSLENEEYGDFLFEGMLEVAALTYTSADFPFGIEINEADMNFSSRFAQLNAFSMKLGESDLSATGRIDNILGYALNDEMLTGTFESNSSFFNLNQFMEGEETTEEEEMELSVIEVPANINFTLQSRFDRILFDDLEITDATGSIIVADQTVQMSNLRMNMLGGSMVLNGTYATHDVTKPQIDFNLDVNSFDIAQTFNTFNTFALIAPIGKRASGNFSAGFDLSSLLDEKLEPVLPTLEGGGSLSSSALTVENSPALVGLADKLKMDRFKQVEVNDVNVSFEFSDGRVDVKPFDVNLGGYTATVSGNHGFDQTIDYLMGMAIPREQFGGAANQVLDNLLSQASDRGLNLSAGETVNVGIAFTGTVSDPQIGLNLGQSAEGGRQQMQDAIEDAVRDVVDDAREQADEAIDEAKQEVGAELEQRASQVLEEAEEQAANIRTEAKNNADEVRKEAREQAQNLEAEASGPIAKAAARRAGEQLIKTADETAARLEREADQQATNLLNEAKQRAEKIRQGEE